MLFEAAGNISSYSSIQGFVAALDYVERPRHGFGKLTRGNYDLGLKFLLNFFPAGSGALAFPLRQGVCPPPAESRTLGHPIGQGEKPPNPFCL